MSTAYAEDGDLTGNVTGGDVNTRGDTVPAQVARQSEAKQEMAAAYRAAKIGRGSASAFEETAQAYTAMYGQIQPRRSSAQIVSRSSASAQLVEAAAADRVLSLEHYGQINDYFCGPGTGRMLLKYLQAGTSAYNGASQDQEHIGGADHMRTEINQVTAWDSGLFRIGINRWREGTNLGYYTDKDDPNVAYFVNSLTFDVDYGYPLAADTVEFAGGAHYNGHPQGLKIGHWIAAHGYYNNAASTRFADPSTTIWTGAQQHFTYDTSDFVTRFLNTNGITW